jgi:hypothetical protein
MRILRSVVAPSAALTAVCDPKIMDYGTIRPPLFRDQLVRCDRANGHRRFPCPHESLALHADNKKCKITHGRPASPSPRPRHVAPIPHWLFLNASGETSSKFCEMLGPPALGRSSTNRDYRKSTYVSQVLTPNTAKHSSQQNGSSISARYCENHRAPPPGSRYGSKANRDYRMSRDDNAST